MRRLYELDEIIWMLCLMAYIFGGAFLLFGCSELRDLGPTGSHSQWLNSPYAKGWSQGQGSGFDEQAR